jgi:copper transport protein
MRLDQMWFLSAAKGRKPSVRRPVLGALLLAIILWLAAPAVASAHAHLVQADPAPDGVIAHAPSMATFLFDEPLNPALTHVRVTDAAGREVAGARGHLAPGSDDELWLLPLPPLPPGTYSAFWTAESATDGHILSSFYTFQVAPGGGTHHVGAVSGAAAGADGGVAGQPDVTLGGGAVAMALCAALGLMAQALWVGALAVDLLVLGPARRAPQTPEAPLAQAATPRLWALIRGAPLVAAGALLGEVVILALQGTGGTWARALAPATLGGILASQNGHLVLARLAILLVAPSLARRVAVSTPTMAPRSRPVRASQALGIVAVPLGMPRWASTRVGIGLLAAVYMLLVALSGHAANVTPAWLSYSIDWLHLVCTAVWVGGMASLTYGVLPSWRTLQPKGRAAAVLPLLDRFSPVAYVAVAALALSGVYDAVHHLTAPAMLTGTLYGTFLLIKLGLISTLMLLSASHVYGLRPHLADLQRRAARDGQALAGVQTGLRQLIGLLRWETGLGGAVLLATAFMSQTLPAAPVVPRTSPTPLTIVGVAAMGALRGELRVTPPQVGTATVTLRLWQGGVPVTADTGAAILHLYPAAHPTLRANLTFSGREAGFSARMSLAATGAWRADVLVRTAAVNEYRTLPFAFIVGRGATFVNPRSLSTRGSAGR